MKILLVGFRDPNHSLFGGYDLIRNMPGEIKLLLAEKYPFGKRFKTHWMRIANSLMDLHARLICRNYDIVHFFYGELTCLPFAYIKGKQTKTIITLHLNQSDKDNYKLIKSLNKFDGIIVLSSQQRSFLEQLGIKCIFIPHGFNSPQYNIAIPKDINNNSLDNKKINVITIGSNYRDFNTLLTIAKELNHINPNVRLHLVGTPKEWKNRFIELNTTSVYNRLNDNEYYTLLEKCDYNFLPLTFATANNTLLEAQSIGIQSILPKIEGISDYGAPAPLNLYYNSFDELVNIFSTIEKHSASDSLKEYSEQFSWSNINKRILNFYKEISDN